MGARVCSRDSYAKLTYASYDLDSYNKSQMFDVMLFCMPIFYDDGIDDKMWL